MSWTGPYVVNASSPSAVLCVLRISSDPAIEVGRWVITQWAYSLPLATQHVAITPLSEPQRARIDQHADRRVT